MIEAITSKGTKVYLAFVPDVGDNDGGWFVEVYKSPEIGMCDYFDWFTIEDVVDCDCSNMNEVERFSKEYIKTMVNY